MANYITNVSVDAASYTSLGSAGGSMVVTNSTTHQLLLGVADTSGNIAGTVTLNPGESYPFTAIPTGAQVFAKIATKITNAKTSQVKTFSGKVTVYKPS